MDITTIKHKQKDGKGPYATLVIKPPVGTTDVQKTEQIEKDAHFGLFVLGTEKHESRRIDNQLRGRSGRQGDPGMSQFYVALDDEIMRKMGGDTIKSIAKRLLPAEELAKLELTQSQFTNSIARAQAQMEGHNFSIRKHLFEYDNVVNKQRMKIYNKRDDILHWDKSKTDGVLHEIAEIIHEIVEHVVRQRMQSEQGEEMLCETIAAIFGVDIQQDAKGRKNEKANTIISGISSMLVEERDAKTHIIADEDRLIQIIKSLFLQSIDKYWIEHIDTMHNLREKVGLYGYAQQDPLVMYKQESFKLYGELWLSIKMEFLSLLFKIDFTQFHGMEGMINFDVVETNEDEFDDNLIGNMNNEAKILKGEDAKMVERGVEVIDLSKTIKQPLLADGKKVGPNDPCPCGSGKKYKKCHG